MNLIDDVFSYKIDTVYVLYKDRLTRIGFDLIESMFKKFGTKIEVVDESLDDGKEFEKEIFDEIISILHTF